MAEEAVDRAALLVDLGARPCMTGEIRLAGDEEFDSKDFVIDSLPVTWSDVERAVTGEMAMTVDDVLNRRTRSVLLDVKAAESAAPLVAERMAHLLNEGEEWIQSELKAFSAVAAAYRPPTSHRPSSPESEGS